MSPQTETSAIAPTHANTKVTVVVLDRHIAQLDRLAVDIRLGHGRAISRTDIIRALVEAAERTEIDLTQANSGSSLAEMLKRHWPNGRQPRREPMPAEMRAAAAAR